MSVKEESSKNKSRREFLQALGIAGIGTAISGAAVWAGLNYDKKKTASQRVRVLTAEK